MNVPFASSGALSAAHYALVRRVELSETPEAADEHLRSEIQAIQRRLTRPTSTVSISRWPIEVIVVMNQGLAETGS